jgi:hypothetical protein
VRRVRVLNNNGQSVFVNCVFSGNASFGAVHGGGGLRNEHATAELVNCALYGNSAHRRVAPQGNARQ